MTKNLKLSLLLSFLFIGSIAHTQEIITDRPDQTESPFAVKPGILQFESGLLFERSEVAEGISLHRSVYPTNLFRIGLFKNLELRIVNEVVSYKTVSVDSLAQLNEVSGTEDMQVGFKYQLTSDSARLIVGVMAHAIIPTGSAALTVNDYGLFSRINLSYDLDDQRNISGNFGYNNFNLSLRDAGALRRSEGNFTYTLVYGQSLSNRVGVYLEAFGDYVEFEEWQNFMDAGMTYLLSDNIQLDYSYGWGLDQVLNYHSIGISVRLPK